MTLMTRSGKRVGMVVYIDGMPNELKTTPQFDKMGDGSYILQDGRIAFDVPEALTFLKVPDDLRPKMRKHFVRKGIEIFVSMQRAAFGPQYEADVEIIGAI